MDPVPNDAVLVAEIARAIGAKEDGTIVGLIHAYYGDLDRANRTPRPTVYLHFGVILGIADRLLREKYHRAIES